MLIFVDESGKYHPADPNPYCVLAAVAIDEFACRDLSRQLFNLKKKFWGVTSSVEYELKGSKLLSKRAFTSPKQIAFVEEIFIVCKQCGLTVFATINDRPSMETFKAVSELNLTRLYSWLLERIDCFMRENWPDIMAVMIFDALDEGTDRIRGTAFSNFLFRTKLGQAMKHICDTAFFGSSAITPGLQIADLFAYCINQKFQGRVELEPFYQKIKELEWISRQTEEEYPLRGIRHIKEA